MAGHPLRSSLQTTSVASQVARCSGGGGEAPAAAVWLTPLHRSTRPRLDPYPSRSWCGSSRCCPAQFVRHVESLGATSCCWVRSSSVWCRPDVDRCCSRDHVLLRRVPAGWIMARLAWRGPVCACVRLLATGPAQNKQHGALLGRLGSRLTRRCSARISRDGTGMESDSTQQLSPVCFPHLSRRSPAPSATVARRPVRTVAPSREES